MTQYATKDKFGVNRPTYTLDDVNMESLLHALEKYDLMHPLGIEVKLKIGKKKSIKVINDEVYFYLSGLPIFHNTREEICLHMNILNAKK